MTSVHTGTVRYESPDEIWQLAELHAQPFAEEALHDTLVWFAFRDALTPETLRAAHEFAVRHDLWDQDSDIMDERLEEVRAYVAADRAKVEPEQERPPLRLVTAPKLSPTESLKRDEIMVTRLRLLYPEEDTSPEALEQIAELDHLVPPFLTNALRSLPHLEQVALTGYDKIIRLAGEPISYIWQDIAVPGTINLLAGGPSEGKTTLLFLILAARLHFGAAIELLGRLIQPAPPDKFVVLIEGEHSEHSTCRKLVKSFMILRLDDAGLRRVIIVARKAVVLGSPEWQDVVKLVGMGHVSDIAIDTVARVAPRDANDEKEQVAIFAEVAKALEAAPAGQTQPISWAVAHTRKNNTSGDLADVSGSVQRVGQADTVMLVKGEKLNGQTVSSTVTFAKLREDPDDYPQPVKFAIAQQSDGAIGISVDDQKVDARPLEERVVELLERGAMTKSALARGLGRSDADTDEALTVLFAAKRIRSASVRVRGVERKGFELRPGLPAAEISRDFSRDS